MIESPKVAARPELHARSWGPAVAVVLICASIALLLSFDAVYERLQWALSAAQPSIAAHPRLGAIAFVLFAALSAILACFSSALLLPAAVFAWGTTVTRGLLWLGWLLGGLATSALGRELRRAAGDGVQDSQQARFISANDPITLDHTESGSASEPFKAPPPGSLGYTLYGVRLRP